MTDSNLPEIGHNSGGVPAEIVRELMGAVFVRYEARKKDLLASVGRVAITDNDSIGRAGDLQAQIQTVIDRVEAGEDEVIEPYRDAVRLAQRRRLDFTNDLANAKQEVANKVAAFRAEQRRLAVAAAQVQAEAEALLRARAAAPAVQETQTAVVADPAPAPRGRKRAAPEPAILDPVITEADIALPAVVGDYGSRTGDRRVKVFTIADVRKVDPDVLNHEKVIAAIEAVCRDLSKVKKTIKGVVITTEIKTTTRK